DSSTYEVELPEELRKRGIHPKFHASLLRPCVGNDEELFPHREPWMFYDFRMPDDREWLVDSIIGHQWNGNKILFHVQWNLGDTTWELLEHCNELKALDDYLDLQGISPWKQLPRRK
ncbi:hypothetical protein K474DRAFT_1577354, partial [Panus rudis PR-1116 ss-1]